MPAPRLYKVRINIGSHEIVENVTGQYKLAKLLRIDRSTIRRLIKDPSKSTFRNKYTIEPAQPEAVEPTE